MRAISPMLIATPLLFAGCSGSDTAPSPGSSAVLAKEEALEARLSRADWECEVRLLGEDGQTSYIWLTCEGAASGQSVPAKVTSEQVQVPRDGSSYAADVRTLFPESIANRILSGEDLRP